MPTSLDKFHTDPILSRKLFIAIVFLHIWIFLNDLK